MPTSGQLRHDRYSKKSTNPLETVWLPDWPDWRSGYNFFQPRREHSCHRAEAPPGKETRPVVLFPRIAKADVMRVAPEEAREYANAVARLRGGHWSTSARSPVTYHNPPDPAKTKPPTAACLVKPTSNGVLSAKQKEETGKKRVRFDNFDEAKAEWMMEKLTSPSIGRQKLRTRKPTPPASLTAGANSEIIGVTGRKPVMKAWPKPPGVPAEYTAPMFEHDAYLHTPQTIHVIYPDSDVAIYRNRREADKYKRTCAVEGFPVVGQAHYENLRPEDRITRSPEPSNPEPQELMASKEAYMQTSRGYFLFRESNFRKAKNGLIPTDLTKWRYL